jgi:hypothetical protein
MTLNSARGISAISVDVTPGDVRSGGSYSIGGPSQSSDFDDANQVYTIKVTGLEDEAALFVDTGVMDFSAEGVLLGGAGKDPDGQTINMGLLYALQIKNTGATDLAVIAVASPAWGGTNGAPVSSIKIAAGGVYYQSIPAGNDLTGSPVLQFGTGGNLDQAFEVVVLGKIPA